MLVLFSADGGFRAAKAAAARTSVAALLLLSAWPVLHCRATAARGLSPRFRDAMQRFTLLR